MSADEAAGEAERANLRATVYEQLRVLAASQMSRLPSGATLQPTALVHEAWLRLGGSDQPDWQSHAHFMAAASEAMRHILIDRARRRSAVRHGGGLARMNIDEIDLPLDTEDDEALLAINDALERLAKQHPDLVELVQLRCFVGLQIGEAARALGLSRTTAYRKWEFARAWLYRDLKGDTQRR